MKHFIISLIVFSFMAGATCQDNAKIEKEKKAVIALNEEERDAFFARDLNRLEAIWIQDDASRRIFSSGSLEGWKKIYKHYSEDIHDDELWENNQVTASFSDYKVRIYGKTALVYHDIQWDGKMGDEEIDFRQKRVVHMVKLDGKWKIDLIIQLSEPDVN